MTTPRPSVSVLSLVRGRPSHLERLLWGLRWQSFHDFEIIIAQMQPGPVALDFCAEKIRVIEVPGEPLPLAAARNAAAGAARGELLVFLDVDCIPGPTLVGSYATQVRESGRCLMGEVRYLPYLPDIRKLDFPALAELAAPHPARRLPPETGWAPEPDPLALWGLSFSLSRTQYFEAGGMDEGYVGYGAEETDFAKLLAHSGVALGWCGGSLALHQHHRVCAPPLDRFGYIVSNAQRFRRRWGHWCMEYWLQQFHEAGLIEWNERVEDIVVLRQPETDEIRAAVQPPEVCFA